MSRYIGPACRLCRREGMKLFLKGIKCTTPKCPVTRRNYPPGQHGGGGMRGGQGRRVRVSDYGLQLREKQKLKRTYGLLERPFRHAFEIASRSKGVTGETLLQILERRLDNVIYRLGFAFSRKHARQVVRHGFVRVNDRKVDLPSYLIRQGDRIEIRGREETLKRMSEAREMVKDREVPVWVQADPKQLKAVCLRLPEKADLQIPVKEQLIVELYSK